MKDEGSWDYFSLCSLCLPHSLLDPIPARQLYFPVGSSDMIPVPPSALVSGWVPHHPSVCSLHLPTSQSAQQILW